MDVFCISKVFDCLYGNKNVFDFPWLDLKVLNSGALLLCAASQNPFLDKFCAINPIVARHGSGSTIHVQSPSRATHTAGGIDRHTSTSVSKSAQAQSEPSGGQFSIQYQQVLR